jgi:hypothetical protein
MQRPCEGGQCGLALGLGFSRFTQDSKPLVQHQACQFPKAAKILVCHVV